MGCSSHSGWFTPCSNSIPLLVWLSFLPILFPVIWVFLETLPVEKKHDMCLQIKSKEKLKRNWRVTKWYQRLWYNFFFCRGVVFYF